MHPRTALLAQVAYTQREHVTCYGISSLISCALCALHSALPPAPRNKRAANNKQQMLVCCCCYCCVACGKLRCTLQCFNWKVCNFSRISSNGFPIAKRCLWCMFIALFHHNCICVCILYVSVCVFVYVWTALLHAVGHEISETFFFFSQAESLSACPCHRYCLNGMCVCMGCMYVECVCVWGCLNCLLPESYLALAKRPRQSQRGKNKRPTSKTNFCTHSWIHAMVCVRVCVCESLSVSVCESVLASVCAHLCVYQSMAA